MHDPLEDTVVFSPAPDFGESFFADPQPEILFDFGAASHVGLVRTRNEDHFAVLRMRRGVELLAGSLASDVLAASGSCSYALVVADGMGGLQSGELASRTALQTMVELVGQATSWVTRLTDPDAQQIEERVNAYVRRIHDAVTEHGQRDSATVNMGTTWTSTHLLGWNAVIVNLGDSRAYLLRDGELRQLTRDQTIAQAMVDDGHDPTHVFKFRHVLLNCMGAGTHDPTASIYHLELRPGDRLLLCSDGLSDMVTDRDIGMELCANPHPQSACDALIRRALASGGRDNVTAVLARLGNALS